MSEKKRTFVTSEEFKSMLSDFDWNGRVFSDELVIVRGSLDLSSYQPSSLLFLPDNLIVNGDLVLSNSNIRELPKNLIVVESLSIHNTVVYKLPDNLVVGGSLDITNTLITELPSNLTVGTHLHLSNRDFGGKDLPETVFVGGVINYYNGANHIIRSTPRPVNLKPQIPLFIRNRKYVIVYGVLLDVINRIGNRLVVKHLRLDTPLAYLNIEKTGTFDLIPY